MLILWLTQNRRHKLDVKGIALGLASAELDEIDHIPAGYFFAVESSKTEIGFGIHIDG